MSITMRNSSPLARGYQAALSCAVILSTTAIFIRYLTQTYHLPPLVLAFWRDAFTALTLVPVLGLVRPALLRVQRRDLLYLITYGLLLSIFNALWTLSVAWNGAAMATVLVYCSAAFTALLGWLFLQERLGWVKVLAVLLSLGGCGLVAGIFEMGDWQINLLGIVTGVFSGLSYAVYSLMGRTASQRGLNPWTTLLYTFGSASIFLLIFNLLPGGWLPGAAVSLSDFIGLGDAVMGWVILFLLAAGPTLIGFGLYNVSLVYLPSSVANLIATLEPAFTAVIAYFLLGERLSGIQIIGSLMILSGVVFLRINEGRTEGSTLAEWK